MANEYDVLDTMTSQNYLSATAPIVCVSTNDTLREMVDRLLSVGSMPAPLLLPARSEEHCRLVARAVALAVAQACYENEHRFTEEEQLALCAEFGCPRGRRPSIPFEDFLLNRLVKYTHAAPEELIAALALVDKAISCGIALTWRTCHRLYASALVVALKFSRDGALPNSYNAKVVGITNAELNKLEIAVLERVGFDAWVDEEELASYSKMVAMLASAIDLEDRRRAELERQQRPAGAASCDIEMADAQNTVEQKVPRTSSAALPVSP